MTTAKQNITLSRDLQHKLQVIASCTHGCISEYGAGQIRYRWGAGAQPIVFDFDWTTRLDSPSYASWICAVLTNETEILIDQFDVRAAGDSKINTRHFDGKELRSRLVLSPEQFLLTLFKGILVGTEKAYMQNNLPEYIFHRYAVANSWRIGMANYRKRYSNGHRRRPQNPSGMSL